MSPALGGDSALAEPQADAQRGDGSGRRPGRPGLAWCSDERLARRAAAGDATAFDEIFRRYQQDLYRFCVGILREPQDAQDAVQNTMIKAMRALPGETRAMRLKPWLYRIAHNEAVELRRRVRPAEPLSPTVDDITAGTEERAEQEVRLKTLLADIADLPERQRASLVMRELNGLGFSEIGAALGTSPGAARQALYEARRGLTQMESGREMDCEVAMKQVSDTDGSPTRRGIRAHLRDCLPCRRFQAEMHERRETLAALSPMPAIAVAALSKSALGGSGAAGGASAVAGGAATGAGGIGVGGAGTIGFSGLAKGAAGLIAALAVGTVAVDHGGILRHQQDPARSGPPPALVRAVGDTRPGSVDAAHHPISGGHEVIAPAATVGGPAAATTGREGVSAGVGLTGSSSSVAAGGATHQSRETAAGVVPPPPTTEASAVLQIHADGGSPQAVPVAKEEGGETPHPEQPAKAEAKVEKAEAKAEAKAEKAEAKAESQAEKAEAKAESQAEKAEAKAEKAESKEHPEHPAHPGQPEDAGAEAAPAEPVETSIDESPAGAGEEAPHGKGWAKKEAEPVG